MKKLILALLLTSCGTEQVSDLDIVGGQRAPYKPYFARVNGCGASLVTPTFLVSAAHCFNKNKPRIVKLGLYRQKSGNGGKPMETIRVKRIIKHPEWTHDSEKKRWSGYDLALIELERPSKFKPIKMTGAHPEDGDRLQAFGFGQTSHPGRAPEYLQGTVFKFNAKASANARPQIYRASAPGKAICFGDSGGPLVHKGRLLIAVNTFTVDDCKPGGMMGFTRLDLGWIRKVIQ